MGTWAGRFSLRCVSRRRDANGKTGDCLGLMVLAVLLITLDNKI